MSKNAVESSPQELIAEPAQPHKSIWRATLNLLVTRREASVLIVAIALVIYFNFANSSFFTLANTRLLAQYTIPYAIIAAGEVMLLILGEIDLSAGNVFALTPVVMYVAFDTYGLPIWIGIILAVLVSAVVGLINGFVNVYLKVPSFVATLGMLFVLNGVTLTLSNGTQQLIPEVGYLNQAMGANLYWESFWAILIVIVMQIVLSWTRWGLHTVSAGGNLLGSTEVGINVNRIKLVSFMMCSIFAGFAGILETFRITSMDPTAGGPDLVFNAVAGSVIGGTALQGGSGTIVGAFLGVLVLALLREGFTLIGVSAFTFNIILGVAILAAMVLNIRLQILRKAGRA